MANWNSYANSFILFPASLLRVVNSCHCLRSGKQETANDLQVVEFITFNVFFSLTLELYLLFFAHIQLARLRTRFKQLRVNSNFES